MTVVTAIGVFYPQFDTQFFKWHNDEYRPLPSENDVRKMLGATKLDAGLCSTLHYTDMKKNRNRSDKAEIS